MKPKRVLAVLLAACLMVGMMPSIALADETTTTPPDPYYQRMGTPEVTLFNKFTAEDSDYYKKNQNSSTYNAVEKGYFKYLKDTSTLLDYDHKEGNNRTYGWTNFYNTKLAYLYDQYDELQIGYSVTTINNPHTHSWGFLGWYSQDVTSQMDTYMYFSNDGGSGKNSYYNWVVDYSSYSKSGKKNRRGNGKFYTIPDPVNGSQTIWRYSSSLYPDPTQIKRGIYLEFVNRDYYYDGGNKTCTHGGWAEGNTVVFADKVDPAVKSVEVRKNGSSCTDFKAGDTVQVVLKMSEPVRFADDSKVGKGNVYIALQVEGKATPFYAHLTRLESNGLVYPDRINELTFEFDVDSVTPDVYTITGIDFTKAPADGEPLIHSSADVPLKTLRNNIGRPDSTFTANKTDSSKKQEGFDVARSVVVDMAGNSIVNSSPYCHFYIDCEDPFVASINVKALTKNEDVKSILNKTDMDPADPLYADESDLFLGVWDQFQLSFILNEWVDNSTGTITATTNIKDINGNYLSITSYDYGPNVAANTIGTQYGKGASLGLVSVRNTPYITISDGMTVDAEDGKIKITSISFNGILDKSLNTASVETSILKLDKAYSLDTKGPSPVVSAAVQVDGINGRFYVPFKVTDTASGVRQLPAQFKLTDPDRMTPAIEYAVTGNTSEPESWTTGASIGSWYYFTQTGDQQYLHIKPLDGESYNINGNLELDFILSDYAGNSGLASTTLGGVALDTTIPTAVSHTGTTSYDNSTNIGTLTAEIVAKDAGGILSVEYQWAAENAVLTADSEGWDDAVGSLAGYPAEAAMSVSVDVASGDEFSGQLWTKVTDQAGNVLVKKLRKYSYSLKGIHYDLEYSTEVKSSPKLVIKDIDLDGMLVFDIIKDETHYVKTISGYNVLTNESASRGVVFSAGTDVWNTAEKDTSDGIHFIYTGTETNPFKDYSGKINITVYSGNGETISWDATGAAINSNAQTAEVVLRVAAVDLKFDGAFTGDKENCITIPDEALVIIKTFPWYYRESKNTCSTLEGLQVSFDIGEDRLGFDYEDIDWDHSYLALDGVTEAHKIVSIGRGPVQTITLPSSDLYTSGTHVLNLVLKRNSTDAISYFADVKDIFIDATEPGEVELGVLMKNSTNSDLTGHYNGSAWFSSYGKYEEIIYDPDATVYIPTENYEVVLSVDVTDADGNPVDYDCQDNVGMFDVVAWNTAVPSEKISLRLEHFAKDTDGKVVMDKDFNDSYYRDGKRSLLLSNYSDVDWEGWPTGVLGLTYDEDNTIALQAVYTNGKTGPVRYLTIHPVTLKVSGTVKTSPELDESTYGPFSKIGHTGTISVDPGTASVIFIPSEETNTAGLRFFCQEGYQYTEFSDYTMYEEYGAEIGEMTPQADGTYVYKVPDANLKEYIREFAPYCEDPDNNPRPDRFHGRYVPLEIDPGTGNITWGDNGTGGIPVGSYIVYAKDVYGNVSIAGITRNSIVADASEPIIRTGAAYWDDETSSNIAYFDIDDDSLFSFYRKYDGNANDILISRPMTLSISFDEAYSELIGAAGQSLTLTVDPSEFTEDEYGYLSYQWNAEEPNKLGITKVIAYLNAYEMDGNGGCVYNFNDSDSISLGVDVEYQIYPKVTTPTDVTVNLVATDAHGNRSEQASVVLKDAVGIVPAIVPQKEKDYETGQYVDKNGLLDGAPWDLGDKYPALSGVSDLALKLMFNTYVQPEASWICPDPQGFSTEWYDGFPITSDGTWTICFTDIFGTKYSQEIVLDDVYGDLGIDLSISTLGYVPAKDGVTITATGNLKPDNQDLYYVWNENGEQEFFGRYEDVVYIYAIGAWRKSNNFSDDWSCGETTDPATGEKIFIISENEVVKGSITYTDLVENYMHLPDGWSMEATPWLSATALAGSKIPSSSYGWPDDKAAPAVNIQATENGDYVIFNWGYLDEYEFDLCSMDQNINNQMLWDVLIIHLDNIVEGGPEEKLTFYFDEFKEEFKTDPDPKLYDGYKGSTIGNVTVSYETSRKTTPIGDISKTFKAEDDDSFSFTYHDDATNIDYTISGVLSDYGITLDAPPEPYKDTEDPLIEMIHVWTEKGSSFSRVEGFSGNASDSDVAAVLSAVGHAQSYDFVVTASDYSNWKVVAKSSAPADISFATAENDDIDGVTVSGNNVFVTEEATEDFYIVVVDNAMEDSAATAADGDNFSYVKIPAGHYKFDTKAPVFDCKTVSTTLYQKTVYINVTDLDNKDNITSDAAITVIGEGVVENNDPGFKNYQYKLLFTDNESEVVVIAYDEAKNSATTTLKVTGIDTTAPVLNVTWAPGFTDASTGKIDRNNPTAGPVNRDVVAVITSDKEITSAWIDDFDTGKTLRISPDVRSMSYPWGHVDYEPKRITVHFEKTDIQYAFANRIELTIMVNAPNGKGKKTTLTLGEGVIDKESPTVTDDFIERKLRDGATVPYEEIHHIDFSEEVYCMDAGTPGTIYHSAMEFNSFDISLAAGQSETLRFSDKAGNLMSYTVTAGGSIDSYPPLLDIAYTDKDATSEAVDITVITDEDCVLSAVPANGLTIGTLTQGADPEGNPIWTGTVKANENGTYRLNATDAAGNSTRVVFTINSIDRTLPTISFDVSTVSLRQDSDPAELTALLDAGIHTWDNLSLKDGTLVYDASGVDLTKAGAYAVTYNVEDIAGNIGESVRYVKIIDKNLPVITIDGELTEENGTSTFRTGEHKVMVSGLRESGEPYKLKLAKGLYSIGQMKRVDGSIEVDADGNFTIETPGFYTLFITTQSRQTYRTLLYVEK